MFSLESIIVAAINQKGYSFINAFSPYVMHNKIYKYDWFKDHITKLPNVEAYDATNRGEAMATLMEHESLVTTIIYQKNGQPSFQVQFKDMPRHN